MLLYNCVFLFLVCFFLYFCLQLLFSRVPRPSSSLYCFRIKFSFGYQSEFAPNHNVINNMCFCIHLRSRLRSYANWPKPKRRGQFVVSFCFVSDMKNWKKMVDKFEKENAFDGKLRPYFRHGYWIIKMWNLEQSRNGFFSLSTAENNACWMRVKRKKWQSRWSTLGVWIGRTVNCRGADLQLKFMDIRNKNG